MIKQPITILTKDAETVLTGSEFMLSPGQERTFKGAPVPFHRRQIVISNEGGKDGFTSGPGAAAHLSIGATNNSEPDETAGSSSGATPPKILTVFAMSNLTLFTNSDVTIRNNQTSRRLLLRVAESFYR